MYLISISQGFHHAEMAQFVRMHFILLINVILNK